MSQDIYGRLADAMDALPNRYPRTASGVEIKIIKKVFTPEEVELAGQMSRKYETVAEIAKRAGLPEDKVKKMLDGMLPRGTVLRNEVKGVERFRLGPFVVGWYERHINIAPTDKEFCELFEQYLREGGAAAILGTRPGVMRVVPVRGSLKPGLLQPYDDIDAHFQRYERFRVINCCCRVEKNLVGSDCKMPVKRCSFSGAPPETPTSDNVLTREQAIKYYAELEEMGHVHLASCRENAYVGSCQCCGCCCGVLRAITDLGLPEGPQRSNYRAVIDLEKCNSCGNCIEYCQVHAITEGKDGRPVLQRAKCIGCGQCVIKCPTEAIELVPVSAKEWVKVPITFEEWEEARQRTLGRA